jgi:outer membrane biosynthesis protein TonB
MVLACVGTLAVGVLGVAGWQMLKPSPEAAASDVDEGSLGAMASNALEVATEMGSVLRENVTRDASRLAEFLVGPEEEEVEEDAEEVDAPADLKAVVATPSRPRVARRAPTPEPAPEVEAAPPVTASIPELLPLPGMFDSGTPGITPPGTENIRLHILDPEQLPTDDQGLVEVIVSPCGEVERAKLISAPGDIHEAMILSAIKAWQFTPARKDGHPVRYRLILPVDVALSGKVMTTRDAP